MFRPNIMMKRIYEITPEKVTQLNIKGLLIDMDNTLLPWDNTIISEESLKWLNSMKECGVSLCVISNSREERVHNVMKDVDIPYVSLALKPLPFNILKAYRLLNVKKKNTYIVGDQLVTDIVGAKIAGLKSILVAPMSPVEHKATDFNRFLERIILKRDVRDTYEKK